MTEIINATLDFGVDRIILGKKITKEKYRNVNYYEVKYNNIDCFTKTRPYIMNSETFEYKGNLNNYDILLNDMKSSMVFSCSEKNDISYEINNENVVIFKQKRKVNISVDTTKEGELFDYVGYKRYYGVTKYNELGDDYEKYKDVSIQL